MEKKLTISLLFGLVVEILFMLPSDGGFYGDRLEAEIRANSSRMIRPVKNVSTPTNVTFRLNLYQILGASAIEQKIHLHFWAEMSWMNEFISWNPEEHHEISQVDGDPKHMWLPDITFFNQLSGFSFNEKFPAPPSIQSSGLVVVLRPFRAELECHLSVTYFPFDDQECPFEVGSWAHFQHEIDIQPHRNSSGQINAADLMFYKASSIFQLYTFGVRYNEYEDTNFGGNKFSSLVFNVAFRRKSAYFVMNLILPSVMINVLCVLNFLIPCDSGEKVGYGITVFLAQSVNLMVVSEMMPQGGTSVLGIFLVASILLIGLSLLMQITALRFYHPINPKQRPSKFLRIFCRSIRWIVGPTEPQSDIVLAQDALNQIQTAVFNSHENIGLPGPKSTSEFVPRNAFGFKLYSEAQECGSTYNFGCISSQAGTSTRTKATILQPISSLRNNEYYQVSLMGNGCSSGLTSPVAKQASSPLLKRHSDKASSGFSQYKSNVGLPDSCSKEWKVLEPAPTDDLHSNNLSKESMRKDMDLFSIEQIAEEWKIIAETVNRVNAIIFCSLLVCIAFLYLYFHKPTSKYLPFTP